MPKTSHEFGFLNACEVRQLTRVNIEERGEWAIVGVREQASFPLVVLTGANAPYRISLHQSGHIDGDFDTYAAPEATTWFGVPVAPNAAFSA
jgi:hypothetical protein